MMLSTHTLLSHVQLHNNMSTHAHTYIYTSPPLTQRGVESITKWRGHHHPASLRRMNRQRHILRRRHGPWPRLDDIADAIFRGIRRRATSTTRRTLPRGSGWSTILSIRGRGSLVLSLARLVVALPIDTVRVNTLLQRLASAFSDIRLCQQSQNVPHSPSKGHTPADLSWPSRSRCLQPPRRAQAPREWAGVE